MTKFICHDPVTYIVETEIDDETMELEADLQRAHALEELEILKRETKCANPDCPLPSGLFYPEWPRFTCSGACRKALSRVRRRDRRAKSQPRDISKEFFEDKPSCKTCGSDLVPDGLVFTCGNLSCRDFDVQ